MSATSNDKPRPSSWKKKDPNVNTRDLGWSTSAALEPLAAPPAPAAHCCGSAARLATCDTLTPGDKRTAPLALAGELPKFPTRGFFDGLGPHAPRKSDGVVLLLEAMLPLPFGVVSMGACSSFWCGVAVWPAPAAGQVRS